MELDEIALATQRQYFLDEEGLESYSPLNLTSIGETRRWCPRVIPKRSKPFMSKLGWAAYGLLAGSIMYGISHNPVKKSEFVEEVDPTYVEFQSENKEPHDYIPR